MKEKEMRKRRKSRREGGKKEERLRTETRVEDYC